MRMVVSFTGSNRDFRAWLAAQRYPNVISLAEYRKNKAAKRAARVKLSKPSIA